MAGEHVFVAMTPPIAMNERLLRRKLLDRLERNDLYALRDVAIASTPLRISERLRKDHPDPAIRAEFYADGKLGEYVRSLMQSDDDKLIERVIAGVHGAEDGTPAHDE